ncbi:MAG: hypothetical protein GPJ54_16555 [Candidatus Heimdallarchaeota archaeon]|nr:hypothetical protein [Candidatus Heimdallarchaeota archaeon]
MGSIRLQGFLQIPNLEDIKKTPNDPYDFPTGGRVHAAKFMLIFDELTHSEAPSKEKIIEEFDGHSLHSTILQLTINDLADFCRHVILANKSAIGWENVDELLLKLDKKYIPYWKMPNFTFGQGFKELFRQLINWELPDKIDFIGEKLTNTRDQKLFAEINERFSSKIQVWNFMDLWSLYNFIISLQNNNIELKENAKLNQIRGNLTSLFQNLLKDRKFPITQRVALGLLFTKAFVEIGSEQVLRAEEVLDKISREVDRLSDVEILSFRYIFGAGYSMIGAHVFQSNSDFITRRRLLSRLISNFLNPPDLSLNEWFKQLIKQDMDPRVIIFIVDGYAKLLDILFEHYLEFPVGNTKEELFNLVKTLSKDILDTINACLISNFNLDINNQTNLKDYLEDLLSRDALKTSRASLLATIYTTTKYYLRLEMELTPKKRTYLELSKLIANEIFSEQEALVFELDFLLYFDEYPFQQILIKIEEEIVHSSSIILSEAFENEIIQKISQMMDYFMTSTTITGYIVKENYEIVLYFASEWLQYFQLSKHIYSEALMVIAPIISICFVQIARAYFENNQVVKAFFTYLNMHYFVELFIDEIKRSATWQSGSGEKAKDRDDISNRFNQLIKDWNFQELLNMKNIKEIVIDIELSLNKVATHSGSSSLSGMLEDDLIFGYMDLTQNLENFMAVDIDTAIEKSVFDQLHEFAIYQRPTPSATYRNMRMGQILGVSEFKELPFPIIRNVHDVAIAVSMFPLELTLPTFSKESKLYQSFTGIFSSEQNDKSDEDKNSVSEVNEPVENVKKEPPIAKPMGSKIKKIIETPTDDPIESKMEESVETPIDDPIESKVEESVETPTDDPIESKVELVESETDTIKEELITQKIDEDLDKKNDN